MVCLNHPDRNATAVCAACGKPLCEDCSLQFETAIYCSEKCHQKGVSSGARAGAVIDSGKRTDRKLRKKSLIAFLVLLLLAGALWYGYTRNQKAVDRKLNKVSRTIKKSTKKAINAGKGAMPQDSKYKRDRENLVNQ